jgi:hypothetical protein
MQSILLTEGGRLLVSHRAANPPQIAVYDTTGRFIYLHVRQGEGPGEFRWAPQLTPGPAGTVWAWEQARLVRLDARLRHLDTKNMGREMSIHWLIPLSSGLVVAGSVAPRDVSIVSLMDSAGNVLRNVERAPESYASAIAAPASSNGFWTLHSNQLLLRRYSDTGELVRTVPIAMDDFEPWSGRLAGEGNEGMELPPRPRHVGLIDIGNNRMVVLTSVLDPRWSPRSSARMIRLREMVLDEQHDTVIRVVDLRSGRVLGSTRAPQNLRAVAGARDLFYTTRIAPDGHVITEIVRVAVGGTNGAQ